MGKIYYIIIIALFYTLPLAAQDDNGAVVIHSDPRLSILMKRKHAEAVAAQPKPRKHAEVKVTAPVTETTASVSATASVATTASAGKAVLPAGTPPPVNMPPGANAPAYVPEAKSEPAPAPARAPIYIREKDEPVVYSGKGFRVQIYSGADRERAIAIKTEFMRNFPGVRTYLTYVSPCFRVKVGNFRSRAEAMGIYREAKESYTPCVIVPDNITINTK